ncbi:hypothetical protein [Pseudomonas sp. MWU12-2345]|uniref:hypothetical protein n=1 Tax=Pseudomonas sp. MWU12-2345 TaxID=2928689 RepID=UPI00200E021A|nr:hypothetical protein [Pseudomonas sp. MWU12-2345]
MREAVLLVLGVKFLALADEQSCIERVELMRLVRDWNADSGNIAMYFAHRSLMPAETEVLIDLVSEIFDQRQFAQRFFGSGLNSPVPASLNSMELIFPFVHSVNFSFRSMSTGVNGSYWPISACREGRNRPIAGAQTFKPNE